MKIGLAYDLKSNVDIADDAPEDAAEEYDPPSTIDALALEIERLGHRVERLGGGAEFLDNVRRASVDLVFNIAEGRGTYRSREAQVPGVLEMLGIPYAGSDPLTLALCLDKPLTKRIAESHGILTPRYRVIESHADLQSLGEADLRFPLVVKPSFEGSSKGIRQKSLVDDFASLEQAAMSVVSDYRQPALVEEYISGAEITVGIVGNEPPRIVGMMEVVPQMADTSRFMYSLEVKRDWERLVSYRCPPRLPKSALDELEAASLKFYKAVGCRDMARIDFRVRDGHAYFLEANPLPGLSEVYSDLPIMARLSGWTFNELIAAILNAALERHGMTEAADARVAAL